MNSGGLRFRVSQVIVALFLLSQTGAIAAQQRTGVAGLTPAPLPGSPDALYYYPTDDGPQVYADWSAFALQLRQLGFDLEASPRVAVGFSGSDYYNNDLQIVNAVIAEIERQGAVPIPFFENPGQAAFQRLLLDENGTARADVALSLRLPASGSEATDSLARVGIPVINLVTLDGTSEVDWRESDIGLSETEVTVQLAIPELAGLIAPTVVGSRERELDPTTGTELIADRPIPSRVEMAVARAMRLQRLRDSSVADRRIALLYYNYPVGGANIGASYLNIAESLATILNSLRDAGYDLGDKVLTADAILSEMTEKARNIGVFAPGELAELVQFGEVELVPVDEYNDWLDGLAPELRAKIIEDWGRPEESGLMTINSPSGPSFVIPRLEYGNVVLMPQPLRGWSADLDKLYHAEDLAPPHQYVAAYSWLREVKSIDAIVHVGTHGTLEWLAGKDTGLSREDATDALIGPIPNINIYSVDVVGEGLVARRRGMATLVDHMVPPFVGGKLYGDLARLSETINDYHNNLHKSVELSAAYAEGIVDQLESTGIAQTLDLDLSLDSNGLFDHEILHEVQDHLVIMREEFIPFGLHTFGSLPSDEAIGSTVQAIYKADRSQLSEPEFYYTQQIHQSILDSAAREIGSLLTALSGGYVGGGSGGEPIRNPDAYPTGKNFYGIDPDKVPKQAAWELGVKLADQMLEAHLAEHGEYPRKLSFVIRDNETMRHEGILESQVLYLLGTRPVWDDRDKVVGVEVIPKFQLGRPRIDIVIVSAAESMFNNITRLMDRAVQEVKELAEAENFVRDHYLQSRSMLMAMGYSADEADRRAGVRIFDHAPGAYSLNTSLIAAASGSWDSKLGLVNDYINKMGHGFGNGYWGEPMQDVFKLALNDVEKVVHSSSTRLDGALNNDDFFQVMGGLALAVQQIRGSTPELLIANTRDPGRPEMSSIDKFIGDEFRTRYLNPTWMDGMMSEGYAGARKMVEFVETLWGWDAALTEVVNDAMWQQTFEVYVQDSNELGMQDFFADNSPFAYQDMTARMLEAIRKEHWAADEQVVTELLQELVASVNEHGISCSGITCGNPRLMEFVLREGERVGLDGIDLTAFREAVETALQDDIEVLARRAEAFARANRSRIAQDYKAADAVAGYRMEPVPRPEAPEMTLSPLASNWLVTLIQAGVVLLLLGWWARRAQAIRRTA